jgi:anti-anti-sigma factor
MTQEARTVSEPQSRIVVCPVVVLAIAQAKINSDEAADTLRDELLTLYNGSTAVHVVLDLRAVTYLSSVGFRPLLSLNRQVRQRGGRLVLCHLRPEVEEVFKVTHLIDPTGTKPTAFAWQPTAAAAVAQICGPGPTS